MEVIQLGFTLRQIFDLARHEPAFLKPVRGTGGKHKQRVELQLPRPLCKAFEHGVTLASMPVVGMYGEEGQLASTVFRTRIKGGTGNQQAVTFNNTELIDFLLQQVAERVPVALFFQWTDQFRAGRRHRR